MTVNGLRWAIGISGGLLLWAGACSAPRQEPRSGPRPTAGESVVESSAKSGAEAEELVSVTGAAAEPAAVAEDGEVVYRKQTVVDFGDATIEGDLTRPDGAYLEARRRTRQQSLVKLRANMPPPAGADERLEGKGDKEVTKAVPARPQPPAREKAKVTAGLAERIALAAMGRAGEELWVVVRPPAVSTTGVAMPGSGELRARLPDQTESVPLPLEHTAVAAQISGAIASVGVRQQYNNPHAIKIEAVYVFPLPEKAAVSEFLMVVGERRIRGIIRERGEAERIYREAREQGYVASLLTQERPNVFTQKVANIEPGHRIDIELTYFEALPVRDGAYVFTFPMVVGPRFNPPGSSGGIGAVPRGKEGSSGQATEVSYLRPGERSGHDLSLTVELDAGMRIEGLESPSHRIRVEEPSPARRRVTLAAQEVIPNADFVLRYRVAGAATKAGFLTHTDARGGFFTLMLEPPAELKRIPRSPRELVFVLDCSGSMSGAPLAQAKAAVRHALGLLDADDTFQIINFSNEASQLGRAPVPATPANLARGFAYLESLESEGGTMMIEGIKAALDFPHAEGRLRLVSFMTDGYIGNETEILAAIHERLGAARIFSFGIGSSVNHYLLERMAIAGRGAVAYVGLGDQEAARAVDDFYEQIAYPALSELTIDWGNLAVSEVYPSRLPDLHVGRPVRFSGRFSGAPSGVAEVRGRVGGKPVTFAVPLGDAGATRPALAQIWARAKIADLADRATFEWETAPLVEAIKETALRFSLMSAYTAFVAVDASRRTDGASTTVAVPVPVPEGVDYDTTVGEH